LHFVWNHLISKYPYLHFTARNSR